MANEYNKLYQKYSDKINIFAVYILEAHHVNNDQEGWPIGQLYRYPQHKTIEDRLKMTSQFINDFNFEVPMYVDTMQDSFNNQFHIWPDKCIIINNKENEAEIVFTALLNEDASRSTSKWVKDITDFIDYNI